MKWMPRSWTDTPGAPALAGKDEQSKGQSKFGTVGAVALDAAGRLAAATSTGGMTNKHPGRIGDSPLIGCGTFADRRVAVSTTGIDEAFIRAVATYDVTARMKYGQEKLEQGAHAVVHEAVPQQGGTGGLIAIDAEGGLAMPFNTEAMFRGVIRSEGQPWVAIYP